MIETMMKALGATGVAVVIVLLLLISPMLFLWALNTFFEQAGSTAYVPHGFWTYLASFVFIGLLRGGK